MAKASEIHPTLAPINLRGNASSKCATRDPRSSANDLRQILERRLLVRVAGQDPIHLRHAQQRHHPADPPGRAASRHPAPAPARSYAPGTPVPHCRDKDISRGPARSGSPRPRQPAAPPSRRSSGSSRASAVLQSERPQSQPQCSLPSHPVPSWADSTRRRRPYSEIVSPAVAQRVGSSRQGLTNEADKSCEGRIWSR